MEHEWKDVTGRGIVEKMKSLEPQQIAEVMDFIEFLVEKKQKESALGKLLTDSVGSAVRLEDVRKRLAKIPGQMSDIMRE